MTIDAHARHRTKKVVRKECVLEFYLSSLLINILPSSIGQGMTNDMHMAGEKKYPRRSSPLLAAGKHELTVSHFPSLTIEVYSICTCTYDNFEFLHYKYPYPLQYVLGYKLNLSVKASEKSYTSALLAATNYYSLLLVNDWFRGITAMALHRTVMSHHRARARIDDQYRSSSIYNVHHPTSAARSSRLLFYTKFSCSLSRGI